MPPRISDAEWDVMDVVWQRGEATAAEVIDAIAEKRDWNHRTVRTLLARLVEKGVLACQAQGNRYSYRPAVSRKKCVRENARTFVEKYFGGDAASLLVHFVKESRIDAADIETLKQLLDEKQGGQS